MLYEKVRKRDLWVAINDCLIKWIVVLIWQQLVTYVRIVNPFGISRVIWLSVTKVPLGILSPISP